MARDISVYQLPVGDVKDFGDKLLCPICSSDERRSIEQVFTLDFFALHSDFSFHEVIPATLHFVRRQS
jgi:hypothetical protein